MRGHPGDMGFGPGPGMLIVGWLVCFACIGAGLLLMMAQ